MSFVFNRLFWLIFWPLKMIPCGLFFGDSAKEPPPTDKEFEKEFERFITWGIILGGFVPFTLWVVVVAIGLSELLATTVSASFYLLAGVGHWFQR